MTAQHRIGEVAELAGVSVRTLHHYDRLGLLTPSMRSANGYRLYTEQDLERLQQILFYRELGFPLSDIRGIVTSPGYDRRRALAEQRDLVAARILRLEDMLALIETTLTKMRRGGQMSGEELLGAFGEFDPARYEDEVRRRWGDTEAYRESARRTRAYGKDDWRRYQEEAAANGARLAALMDESVAADDPRALAAVEEARLLIDRWFYPCSRAMHASLGEMYVADARFTATYEAIRPGMARYLRDATAANAARGED